MFELLRKDEMLTQRIGNTVMSLIDGREDGSYKEEPTKFILMVVNSFKGLTADTLTHTIISRSRNDDKGCTLRKLCFQDTLDTLYNNEQNTFFKYISTPTKGNVSLKDIKVPENYKVHKTIESEVIQLLQIIGLEETVYLLAALKLHLRYAE